MKSLRLLFFLLILPGSCIRQSQAADLITVTVTLTNTPAGPASNFTFQGSTRYWSNSVSASPGTSILITNNPSNSATQLLNHLTSYPVSTAHYLSQSTPTNVTVRGRVGEVLTFTVAGGWASVSYSTQTVSSPTYVVRVPISVEAATNQTNIASLLVTALQNSTNAFRTNDVAVSNLLQKGAGPTQTVQSGITFNGPTAVASNFFATNGFTLALTNINPVNTNLVVYGGFRSEGAGANSFAAGSNALAPSARSIAIGNNALATNADTLAVGVAAQATNLYAVAVGNAAHAWGSYSTAIGQAAYATNNGTAVGTTASASGDGATAIGIGPVASGQSATAIGDSDTLASGFGATAVGTLAAATGWGSAAFGRGSTASHSNSFALGVRDWAGVNAATTSTNQGVLGTAGQTISIPGVLLVSGSQSNTTFQGTNVWRGDVSFPPFVLNTLANGNNISVFAGTNRYVRIDTGSLTASPTICGVIGGATTGGRDGQPQTWFNNTPYAVVFAVTTADPIAANRILNYGSLDVSVQPQGWITLWYSASDSRWHTTELWPVVATATNAVATLGGSATNLQTYQTAGNATLTHNALIGSATNIVQTVSTNGALLSGVNSNGTLFARPVTGGTSDAVQWQATNAGAVAGLNSNGTWFARALTGSTADLAQWQTTNGVALGLVRSNHTAVFSNLAVTPFAAEVGVPFRLFTMTNDAIVTNVTAATSVLSNLLGTATFPANFWRPGMTVTLELEGKYFSGATAAHTNAVTLGGSQMATNLVAWVIVAAGEPWAVQVRLTCRSTGASGSFYTQGYQFAPSSVGGVASGRTLRLAAGAVTIDTTAATALDYVFHPGASTTALHVHAGRATIHP